MGKTKSMYVVNHWLAPFWKSLLLIELNKSVIFVFSFDENLTKLHRLVKCVFRYSSGKLPN